MQFIKTKIPDVMILEPKVFGDDRGFFIEALIEKATIVPKYVGFQNHYIWDFSLDKLHVENWEWRIENEELIYLSSPAFVEAVWSEEI